ncbi:hypothetical protein SAMN05421818_1493 [Myroides phaeus]|uniref:Uncharacterized protein n=1 Tax=Myroides phaeus TaxID=702745 RepID=A0A1G8H8U5_9FLAO|nr:hypothetical protein SAMN05421818_1493 [Myroides phaeus]
MLIKVISKNTKILLFNKILISIELAFCII